MSMTTFILIVGLVLLTLAAINEAIVLLKWMYEHNSRGTRTELTDRELEYCVNDVRCLVEAKRKLDGDNLYTTTAAGGVNNGKEKQ